MSDQPVAKPISKQRTTQTQNKRIHTPNIHILSGIRTHDPSVRASEDGTCLRPRSYWTGCVLRLRTANEMHEVYNLGVVEAMEFVWFI
jgi:hypothetical protein